MLSCFTRLRHGARFAALLALGAESSSPAFAAVTVVISRAAQTMSVRVDEDLVARWRVSTARRGYVTPPGSYRPIRLERMWYSSKYESSPMPNSIFFRGGYAIHGTYDIRHLGSPVSHGCVRLHPANAKALYDLVKDAGRAGVRIIVR